MKWLTIISTICLLFPACAVPTTRSNEQASIRLKLTSQFLIQGKHYSVKPVTNITVIASCLDYPNGEYIQKTYGESIIKEKGKTEKREVRTNTSNMMINRNTIIIEGDHFVEYGISPTNTIIIDKKTRKISGLKDEKMVNMANNLLKINFPRMVSSGSIFETTVDIGNGYKVTFSMVVQGIVNMGGIPMLLWTGGSDFDYPKGISGKADYYWLNSVYENLALIDGISKMTISIKKHGKDFGEMTMFMSINVYKKKNPAYQEEQQSEENKKKNKLFKEVNT